MFGFPMISSSSDNSYALLVGEIDFSTSLLTDLVPVGGAPDLSG